ncbi:hypothetical protein ELG88_17955 [Rhizobium leguminosarum]|uniref:hypothetical protein n=1 Tax=Rhizobium leguminosarum TaxID=384 RepID=UPI001031CEA9|nr:hypothetical protein [Rhizobium leguminosarum]TBF36971.1 hypothetical protein ELG88_17955 [Rhizobium leguminosarum]
MYEQADIFVTPKIAKRLIALSGVRVGIPVAPLPGEGLADLIYRAACLNRFNRVRDMVGLGFNFSHAWAVDDRTHNLGLADRLGTPNGHADLEPLMYRRFSSGASNVNFFGASLSRFQLMGKRRVSPLSLKSSLHSKAIWHLRGLSFDPNNYQYLISSCPNPSCSKELNFIYPLGVNRCHRCGYDLREAESEMVVTDDKSALDFVTGLVDPERPEGKRAVAQLHPDLRGQNPGELFTLCVLIGAAFQNQDPTARRKIATSTIDPPNLAIAARAVLTWPDGLADIVSRLGRFRGAAEGTEPHSFSRFCKDAGVLNKETIGTIKKVIAFSRSGHKQARCLRRLEVINPNAKRSLRLEVAALTAASTDRYFLQAASISKLPPIVLYDSYLEHLDLRGPNRQDVFGKKVLAWASELYPVAVSSPTLGQTGLPLRDTVNTLFRGRGNVWPHVLAGVRNGMLPIVRAPAKGQSLESLYVQDFPTWQRFLAGAEGVKASLDYPLTSIEVAFFLNMSIGAAQTLFDYKSEFTFKHLHRFKQKFALVDELVCLAAIQGRELTRSSISRRLVSARIRSTGDRYVRRAPALRHLGLDF